ncbi:hypothetical protein OH764_33905 (plasmid) [Burkholderia sp. M6-3]
MINRLGALDDELATIVSELHPNVLADMVNTLALFLKLRTSFLGKAFPRLTICSDTAVMSGPSISTTKKRPIWRASIILAGALTQDFCYRAAAVASCSLLPVRMLAGTTYDEAAKHDNTTGIDRGSR